ncbi:MAG: lytic transglycosylase, partial [Deltaproteobacteria bacterium]|nr:lytic transglycosylase [Deltaproteobacteria bacterium]
MTNDGRWRCNRHRRDNICYRLPGGSNEAVREGSMREPVAIATFLKGIFLCVLCLFPLGAYPEVYTYVDKSGTSHFTNIVPVNKKFRVVGSERIKYVVAGVFNDTTYDTIIKHHAQAQGIDASLVKAVMKAESN